MLRAERGGCEVAAELAAACTFRRRRGALGGAVRSRAAWQPVDVTCATAYLVAAGWASKNRRNVLGAAPVRQQHGRSVLVVGCPAIPPTQQGNEDGVRVHALLGKPVLVPFGAALIGQPLEDTLVDEARQPFGQDVAGDPEPLLDLLEPPKALVHVADDQETPLLPDDIQCASNRTVHVSEGPRGHGFTIV